MLKPSGKRCTSYQLYEKYGLDLTRKEVQTIANLTGKDQLLQAEQAQIDTYRDLGYTVVNRCNPVRKEEPKVQCGCGVWTLERNMPRHVTECKKHLKWVAGQEQTSA